MFSFFSNISSLFFVKFFIHVCYFLLCAPTATVLLLVCSPALADHIYTTLVLLRSMLHFLFLFFLFSYTLGGWCFFSSSGPVTKLIMTVCSLALPDYHDMTHVWLRLTWHKLIGCSFFSPIFSYYQLLLFVPWSDYYVVWLLPLFALWSDHYVVKIITPFFSVF